VRTVVVVLAVAGCGRLGFDEQALVAGDVAIDVPIDATVDPSLLVWYRMEDDPTDGNLTDSAGGDNLATCAAGFTCGTTAPGVRGSALRLAPPSCYGALSTSALVTPTAFTVALWFRPEVTGAVNPVTKRYSGIFNSWGVRLEPGNLITFESAGPGSPPTSDDLYTSAVPLSTWLHLAITWDDTTKAIYLNGALEGTTTPLDLLFDNGEILVGCDQDDGVRFGHVTGLVDEIQVYDRVLTPSEIDVLAIP